MFLAKHLCDEVPSRESWKYILFGNAKYNKQKIVSYIESTILLDYLHFNVFFCKFLDNIPNNGSVISIWKVWQFFLVVDSTLLQYKILNYIEKMLKILPMGKRGGQFFQCAKELKIGPYFITTSQIFPAVWCPEMIKMCRPLDSCNN